MGSSYVWVCDARREFIDPYPLNEPHLFAMVSGGGRWQGCVIRLLSDFGGGNDEYYLRTCRQGDAAGAGDDPGLWGGGADDVYADVTRVARELARERFKGWDPPLPPLPSRG